MIPKSKLCKECGEVKEKSEFYRTTTGLSTYCKLCNTAMTKAWQKANPDKVRQQKKVDYRRPNVVKSEPNLVKSEKVAKSSRKGDRRSGKSAEQAKYG